MVHHGAGLLRLVKDEAFVEQLKVDWQQAELNETDRVMLQYAHKLTMEPWKMIEADVIALRSVGFSDKDILDINQIVGYYAYVNRLADGLGVELEAFWQQ